MIDINKNLKNMVDSSGFPLQLRVEEEIKRFCPDWFVEATEHPWKDEESVRDGYIDMIVVKGPVRLVIECKRVLDSNWIFLIGENILLPKLRVRILYTNFIANYKKEIFWEDYSTTFKINEANFCVVRGEKDKDKPMLERQLGLLIESLESLAVEELKNTPTSKSPEIRNYVPLIITTARLQVCKFKPSDIDLNKGQIKSPEFEEVPFICFRKSIMTNYDYKTKSHELYDINKQKERSAFIVNSNKIKDFLKEFDLRIVKF